MPSPLVKIYPIVKTSPSCSLLEGLSQITSILPSLTVTFVDNVLVVEVWSCLLLNDVDMEVTI